MTSLLCVCVCVRLRVIMRTHARTGEGGNQRPHVLGPQVSLHFI